MTILSNDWDEPFEGEIPETDADLCRAMWIAVILQALLDAKSNSLKKCLQKKRAEAREWLGLDGKQDSEDYKYVCDLAGIDIVKMNRVIQRVLANEGEPLDFRCLKKARISNRGGEQRSSYFRHLKRRKIRRVRARKEENSQQAVGR